MKLTAIAAILTMALMSANQAEVYNEGNAKYRGGDYDGALALYNSIETINPNLEYNRGAAYLKTGKLGKATVHFHRVLKLRPDDSDAQASLDYIRSVKPDRERQERPGALERFFADIRAMFSVNALSWATLILLYLTSVALSLFILAKDAVRRRLHAGLGVALTAMTIVSVAALAVMASGTESRDMAVAVEKSVDAFAEPSGRGDKIFTFHEGTTCEIGRMDGSYAFVTLGSGISGWVEVSKLEII